MMNSRAYYDSCISDNDSKKCETSIMEVTGTAVDEVSLLLALSYEMRAF